MPKLPAFTFVWTIVIFLPALMAAQAPCSDLVFSKWIEETYDTRMSIFSIVTSDGNLVIPGEYITAYGARNDSLRCLLYKINEAGELVWQNGVRYDQSYEEAYAVAEAADGSLYVAGSEASLIGADTFSHDYLAKFDKNGHFLWEKVIDPPSVEEYFRNITICPNGDLAMVEYRWTGTQNEYLITRLDSLGNLIWSRPLTYANYGLDIVAIPTGGFWLAPYAYFTTFMGVYSRLIQLDDAGNVAQDFLAQRPTNPGIFLSLVGTDDGGVIGIGHTEPSDPLNGDYGLWIVKFDPDGTVAWERVFGGSGDDFGYQITPIPGGGYYALGTTQSSDGDVCRQHGVADIWVLQLDDSGNVRWHMTYGGSEGEFGYGLLTLPDGFMVAGESYSRDGDAAIIPSQVGGWALWTFQVTNLHTEQLDIGPRDTFVCVHAPLSLSAQPLQCNENQLVWSTGKTADEIQIDSQGIYWAESSNNRCLGRDSVQVHYLPCNNEQCILFPNAFTPNDDGINDYFAPINQCGDLIAQRIWIYNRWGELVHTEDGAGTVGWDGTNTQGNQMASDVYTWRCTYQNLIGGVLVSGSLSGDLTLIR